MAIVGHFTMDGNIIRSADGALVPADELNRDYRDLLAKVSAGDELAPYTAPAPIVLDVYAERDRRLAGGFDYEFGDERGAHRINTTPGDMVGWDEVTKLAQAYINGGLPDKTITIATGTGVVQLTAAEWQDVIIASAAFRQPIWGASFGLERLPLIPSDFRDDAYWTPPTQSKTPPRV